MTLLFLCFMMALVKYLQPYNKYCLNQLEFLSLLTSSASVYFCIYFISNKIDSSQISKLYCLILLMQNTAKMQPTYLCSCSSCSFRWVSLYTGSINLCKNLSLPSF
ncbi:hypothetical protein FGO68_gene15733 [Halteria grandinella]|uniref:Uncharacterized protein n=1 Tax=Halteria grandinella TaxID=5974 RepID=A0A8J8TB66_HALGN|nr:hypothetical protein FGO68_gene15733 [Halteria grandinella]